jgi:hypothetical protein
LMRIAIVTMAYNERVNLPIWIRHYTKHCPGATLFVIDHGSDDGSTSGLTGVNIIALPRTPFDDQMRVEVVADLQHELLGDYDVVLYVDCDEMLVADPRKHASLASFLAVTESEVIAPVGLNLQHLIGTEAPIDLEAPILGQRRHVRFASGMCKPSIARVPLLWVPGFHWCDRMPDYRADLYQFHLKWMDMGTSLGRLRLTRDMAWSERALRNNWARRQRQSDQERIREDFEKLVDQVKIDGVAQFIFDVEMKRHFDSLRLQDGLYQGDFFRGPVAEVPEAFFGLI